ncbi:hydroxyacid dehydrogenase [Nonomuraea roseoviolacea subsp. roseoviolacea]|uniref:Phosphoglycerate dehydrogenase-like enzyme n=1 Tax=Nonomuraea roseoviolacea subsp. carminata TaxID=160689 RepID=A0ABT1JW60_9ACTN|nr:hydroxyacid dehydrogenase [Nonomuraea roseoviolacea]MCP2345594.1 phosphoglycerate dehydrogenase-like enzyme [Nonomuraea roseoviolacea subsp. carminata]
MRRPPALLVMDPATFSTLFEEPQLRRLRELAELGDPLVTDDLDTPEARRRLREVEVLVTSWGCPRLTEERLAGAPGLRAIFHCAGTVRTFVTDEVWRRGILVTNAADENAIPVAEFTLAAIIFAGKKAPFLAQDARRHRADWSFATSRGELSNRGRTIGVVGYSRVGRRVVERLRDLEVDVLVADPYADSGEVAAAGARLVELPELLRRSDVLTLHVPALPSTRHLIGAAELAMLRDGATVINTARGSVLDTAALERECVSGRLDAMLDVTDPEPLPADSPLYDLPNVMITPHIAGSLGSETRRMSESALDELDRYLHGRPPRAAVTADEFRVSA